MTQEEIISYLKVGRSKSVCVDVSIVEELPSFVRDVEIYNPSRVLVSFHNYGNDADGVQFWHEFVSLDDAILFLETYLKKPREAWGNFTDRKSVV